MSTFTIIEDGLPKEINRRTIKERAHDVGFSDTYIETFDGNETELERMVLPRELAKYQ